MTGLRERKKETVRGAIAEVAMTLFAERGFDAVTYAEIAMAADVAVKTVFNYFPVKEDLVLSGRTRHEKALLDAVEQRSAGVSILSAVLDCTLAVVNELEALPKERRNRFRSVLAASPRLGEQLRSRTRETERALAERLATEIGALPGDLRPQLAAAALMSLWHLAFVAHGDWGTGVVSDQTAESRIREAARMMAEGLATLGKGRSTT
jgi:AcrR family transcriptional regulator